MEEIKDPVNLLTTNLLTGEEKLSGFYERESLVHWIVRCKREGSEGILQWELKEI